MDNKKDKISLPLMILIEWLLLWVVNSNSWIVNKIIYYRTYLYIISIFMVIFFLLTMKDKYKQWDRETWIRLIIIIGVLLRGIYIISAPYNISKHDLGSFQFSKDSEITQGHLGYIGYLYHFKQLPDFDPTTRWAFYNPPGFHLIGAIWYGINRLIGLPAMVSLENLQVLTLGFSSGIVYLAYQIVKEFIYKNKVLITIVAFLSFFPFFTILGAMLNNDCLALFCSMVAILYTIRWYRKPTKKNIIIIAISMGYGMFTKLSVGLLAFAIGYVFLHHFFMKKEKRKSIFVQFILFGVICVPIGLFWPVRNAILYHVPMTYVPKVTSQYIGFHSIWNRIGIPSLQQIKYPFIQFDTANDSNLWVQLAKSGLYDEVNPPITTNFLYPIASLLFWITLLLGGVTIIMAVRLLIKSKRNRTLPIFFSICFGTSLISYMKFCFNYPQICTMNFRYIATIVLLPCLIWPQYLCRMKQKTWLGKTVYGLVICFIGLSIVMNGALILWAPNRY